MITLSHDGTSSCAFDPHDFNYRECIRLWNEWCAANKSAFRFRGMAREIIRIDRVLTMRELAREREVKLRRWKRMVKLRMGDYYSDEGEDEDEDEGED